jgi:hypothetical protein
MGTAYERAKYRRNDLIEANDQLLASTERRASAFMHPELEKDLPEQTLLIYKIHEDRNKKPPAQSDEQTQAETPGAETPK